MGIDVIHRKKDVPRPTPFFHGFPKRGKTHVAESSTGRRPAWMTAMPNDYDERP
ncbi:MULTISPECIES: hypothetical protein [Bifidobacterium]|uniref:hypothetical protein n=1 Tax=Bifidobacterium TaxID=1678 RepID=UPI0013D49F04|nr:MULTISPECIES: hypothetical protein [Bifidobacterium]